MEQLEDGMTVVWDGYPWEQHTEAYRNAAPAILKGETDILWTPHITRPRVEPTGVVIDTVAALSGVPRSDLFGKEKFRRFSHARYVIWLILHEDYGQTYSELARCFNRTHQTVSEGVAKGRRWRPNQKLFGKLYRATRRRLKLTEEA